MPRPILTVLTSMLLAGTAGAGDARPRVGITPTLSHVEIRHKGQTVRIQRDQNLKATIHPKFQLTSRRCPPFCIQPIVLAPGVETIGEVRMLEYLRRQASGDDSVLVIDSRGRQWLKRGTIPGAVNIHYKKLSLKSADEADIAEILEDRFGAQRMTEFWSFRNARTLVLFCNGTWCGQAPTNIRNLLRIGYPPSKLKWYRGGMQSWSIAGLTTVKP